MPRSKKGWVATHGNCYEDCAHILMEQSEKGWVLVHGHPRLTRMDRGVPAGSHYGHAWLEKFNPVNPTGELLWGKGAGYTTCLDVLSGMEVPKEMFYQVGCIEEADVRRYTMKETYEMLFEHDHYGPWHDGPPNSAEHPDSPPPI